MVEEWRVVVDVVVVRRVVEVAKALPVEVA